MTSIIKAGSREAALLATLAKNSFLESHGNSADPEDIQRYITEKYSEPVLKQELTDPKNIYHIIYYDKKPAGYSKIIFDTPCPNILLQPITKLERLYLLKEFYNTGSGSSLFQFNLTLSKRKGQVGIWLYVWKENTRAVQFYLKNGFRIIGSYDYRISATHSNPNHLMLLEF